MKTLILLLATMTLLISCSVSNADTNIVSIRQGKVEGTTSDGVTSFLGIPYAKAPVGDLRWRAPQPPEKWEGTYKADSFRSDPMQPTGGKGAFSIRTKPNEDCLYLNIWKPSEAKTDLPVMVWIYGGAYMSGGSSVAIYDGREFAKNGVMLVSFNYRVGRFGFFAHPALSSENTEEPNANYAFMDQIAALKWIKENIASFGGNPENVTIFGESAGGGSVEAMLHSPLAAGLFQKAIIQSCGPTGVLTDRLLNEDKPGFPSAETFGLAFAQSKGIYGSDSTSLEKLRNLDALEFNDLANGLPTSEDISNTRWGGSCLDGKIFTMSSDSSYTSGQFNRVPLLLGATLGDLPGPMVNGKVDGVGNTMESALERYAPYQKEVLATFADADSISPFDVAYEAGSAWFMIEPVRHIARSFAAAGQPVYEYRFSYDKKGQNWKYGSPHASELPFLFGTMDVMYGDDVTELDRKVSEQMIRYWSNFAKTGNPNGEGLAEWPSYDKNSDIIMEFQADGTAAAKKDPLQKRLDAVGKRAEGRINIK